MNQKIQKVTDGLVEMIKPYLGRHEYGNLCIVGTQPKKLPNWEYNGRVEWFLNYEMVFGSSSGIGADFLKDEQIFEYLRHPDHQKTRTVDSEEVLNYFRQRLEYIKPQRIEHLRKNVKLKKEKGVSLETAVANMREFAEQNQEFGPTEEELRLYEQFCQEVYSTE